jgi:hypothetical protein
LYILSLYTFFLPRLPSFLFGSHRSYQVGAWLLRSCLSVHCILAKNAASAAPKHAQLIEFIDI